MYAGVESCLYEFELDGKKFKLPPNRQWSTTYPNMMRLAEERRVYTQGNTPRFIRYLDDFPVAEISNIWADVMGSDDKLYVVQTNPKVVTTLPTYDDRPWRPRSRSNVRERDDGIRGRAMGPPLDHGRRIAGAAGPRPATPADRHVRLVRIEGRCPRTGGRLRLQTQTEQEGGGSRRDRAARHAQVDRQQRAARRGSAGGPPGGQTRYHSRDRAVLRGGDDSHAGGLGGGRRIRHSPCAASRRRHTGCAGHLHASGCWKFSARVPCCAWARTRRSR